MSMMEQVPLHIDDHGAFGECARDSEHRYTCVDGGDTFSIGVVVDGTLRGWGIGFYGELGEGSAQPTSSVPRTLNFPIRFRFVACGDSHVIALSTDGSVYAWGSNSRGQAGESPGNPAVVTSPRKMGLNAETQINQLAAGAMHSFALEESGVLWSWGDNEQGQLGSGPMDAPNEKPRHVSIGKELRVKQVACGFAHSAVVMSDGSVMTFGWGLYHQLGHGSTQDVFTPQRVDALDGIGGVILGVACGTWHTAAISSQGDVYVWGWGPDGQLGPNHGAHVRFPSVIDTEEEYFAQDDQGHHAVQVYCTARSTLVLSREGELFCWGKEAQQMTRAFDGLRHRTIERLAVGHDHAMALLQPLENG